MEEVPLAHAERLDMSPHSTEESEDHIPLHHCKRKTSVDLELVLLSDTEEAARDLNQAASLDPSSYLWQ